MKGITILVTAPRQNMLRKLTIEAIVLSNELGGHWPFSSKKTITVLLQGPNQETRISLALQEPFRP